MDPTTFCNVMAEALERRHQAIADLRELADLLEANPMWATKWSVPTLHVWEHEHIASQPLDADEPKARATRFLADSARVMAKGQPLGTARKGATDAYYSVTRGLGGTTSFYDRCVQATVPRSLVCEYVDTGETEEVEVVEIPDEVRAQHVRTEQRPVMERVCSDLLLPGYEVAS